MCLFWRAWKSRSIWLGDIILVFMLCVSSIGEQALEMYVIGLALLAPRRRCGWDQKVQTGLRLLLRRFCLKIVSTVKSHRATGHSCHGGKIATGTAPDDADPFRGDAELACMGFQIADGRFHIFLSSSYWTPTNDFPLCWWRKWQKHQWGRTAYKPISQRFKSNNVEIKSRLVSRSKKKTENFLTLTLEQLSCKRRTLALKLDWKERDL